MADIPERKVLGRMPKRRLKAGPEVVDIALPQLHRHSLVHCSQRFDWDCGVACVMMMLSRRQRQQFLLNFKQICDEEGFGQSTWTIDLCYLLWRFKIRHAYTTITVGVNPDFRSHDYYGPILWRDHVRVSTKFDSAACKGLTIQKKTVDNQAILEHLAKYGPVIVLTNGYLLHCDLCHFAHPKCLDKLRNCFSMSKAKTKFSGHFIVVCGYDNRIGCVFYRNPGLDDRICVMSYRRLTEARTAEGTDEDLIFIFLEP